MAQYIKNQNDYSKGFQAGYLACSQVANDEHCPVTKANNSYHEGYIDGWNECNIDDFENEIGLYD